MTVIDKELEQAEAQSIKSKLDIIGREYPANAKLDTLKKIMASVNAEEAEKEPVKSMAESIDEMLRLVRVSIVCLNPNKKDWKGQHLTVGNSVIGHHTFFVPYNCEQAKDFELPFMVVENLKFREYLDIAPTMQDVGGGKRIQGAGMFKREFIITELD